MTPPWGLKPAFAGAPMPPPTIKDILRLKLHGTLSYEAIALSLSVSKGVVPTARPQVQASGLSP